MDVLAFRKTFEVREEDGPLTIDISAYDMTKCAAESEAFEGLVAEATA